MVVFWPRGAEKQGHAWFPDDDNNNNNKKMVTIKKNNVKKMEGKRK